ncbi:hypothetical protein [Limimaricola cinnabarinus]|uniref:Uncharacterized protein n=1 Tax=Limimaricola cinnabarinus LL-001 TaxID=1337093 RepID=U2YQA8_9RHOB|nr:hypothetical protein [Limimaricola cinnabarinus]GAD57611.1 hypothetical protein MBELCI_3663 [Limimaricola cinnabarinus LL-001]
MFDITQFSDTTRLAPAGELREFVEDHRDALLDTADWLGDRPGLRLAQAALDGLAGAGQVSRRTLRLLDDLRDLLMLGHVHAPTRHETPRLALIDPADPRVDEVCLLADGLSAAIDAYRDAVASSLRDPERAAT